MEMTKDYMYEKLSGYLPLGDWGSRVMMYAVMGALESWGEVQVSTKCCGPTSTTSMPDGGPGTSMEGKQL